MKKILMLSFLCFFIILNLFIYDNQTLISFIPEVAEVLVYDKDDNGEVVTVRCSLSDVLECNNISDIKFIELEDRLVVEGYCDSLSKFVVNDGRKMNVQMSVFDDVIVIGYPLIKKSFWLCV